MIVKVKIDSLLAPPEEWLESQKGLQNVLIQVVSSLATASSENFLPGITC